MQQTQVRDASDPLPWAVAEPPNRIEESVPQGSLRISIRLLLQDMSVVLDVLTTIARVGGRLEAVASERTDMAVVLVAREPVAIRLPRLLDQLVGVIQVRDRQLSEGTSVETFSQEF